MARNQLISIVIPAHNERATIGRNLSHLLHDTRSGEFDVIVVCNGCTDDTADVARELSGDLTIVETPIPSKAAALALGDRHAQLFPRMYLDADVEIHADDVRALVQAVGDQEYLAAAPRRRLDLDGASRLVRWYYDIWQELPQVQFGLFGRGVIVLSAAGHERIRELPAVLSDDLAMSEAFKPQETTVVPTATVVIRVPKTIHDLLRRRIRVVTGNAQLDEKAMRSAQSQTSARSLWRIARHDRSLIPRMPIFLAVSIVAKLAAMRRIRRRDFTSWLRDESSRTN